MHALPASWVFLGLRKSCWLAWFMWEQSCRTEVLVEPFALFIVQENCCLSFVWRMNCCILGLIDSDPNIHICKCRYSVVAASYDITDAGAESYLLDTSANRAKRSLVSSGPMATRRPPSIVHRTESTVSSFGYFVFTLLEIFTRYYGCCGLP